MVKGLYTAWTGMRNEQHRMDILTNNLANADTTGYKKEGSVSQTFSDLLGLKIKDLSEAPRTARGLGILNLGVKLGETYVDWSEGPFKDTGDTYSLAIAGRGFFAIEYTNRAPNVRRAEEGETTIMYTRDGDFTLTHDGTIVTQDGDFVLDQDGNHIQVDPTIVGNNTQINEQGQIIQNGQVVGQVGLFDFEDYDALEHYGENFFEPVEEAVVIPAEEARIRSGFLEQSNVSVVDEMVSMITVQRQYETLQKMIQTEDDTINTAVTQVGRLQ